PASAACTSCHDTDAAVAHAATNTSAAGAEACAACHGPNRDYSVARVHALAP
ncbi:MAG: cytochrome c3 family protein, partial [Myxococcota bacterium]